MLGAISADQTKLYTISIPSCAPEVLPGAVAGLGGQIQVSVYFLTARTAIETGDPSNKSERVRPHPIERHQTQRKKFVVSTHEELTAVGPEDNCLSRIEAELDDRCACTSPDRTLML